MEACKKTFTESTIKSAFKKSGIYPVDPTTFGDHDYTPSIPTSTTATNILPSLQDLLLLSSVSVADWLDINDIKGKDQQDTHNQDVGMDESDNNHETVESLDPLITSIPTLPTQL